MHKCNFENESNLHFYSVQKDIRSVAYREPFEFRSGGQNVLLNPRVSLIVNLGQAKPPLCMRDMPKQLPLVVKCYPQL